MPSPETPTVVEIVYLAMIEVYAKSPLNIPQAPAAKDIVQTFNDMTRTALTSLRDNLTEEMVENALCDAEADPIFGERGAQANVRFLFTAMISTALGES